MKPLPEIPCKQKCEKIIRCDYGLIGDNASKNPLFFVLNYPDKRILQESLFLDNYQTALAKTKTGIILEEILEYCNIPLEEIVLTNFFKGVFSTNKKKPSAKEYRKCFQVLGRQIQEISPSKIIFFGDDAKRFIKKGLEIPTFFSYHPSAIWAKTISSNPKTRERYYKEIKEFLEQD